MNIISGYLISWSEHLVSDMEFSLGIVVQKEKSILRQLLELQAYDCSEFNGEEVNDHGCFGYSYLDNYWTEEGRYAYLFRVIGNIAEFAMVREIETAGHGAAHSLAEIFVLRKYRRRGVGRLAAISLFDQFPGRWHVAQEPENKPAQLFWRDVIRAYTSNQYESFHGDDGIYQIFESNTRC